MMKEIGDGNFECTLDTNFEPGAARKKSNYRPSGRNRTYSAAIPVGCQALTTT